MLATIPISVYVPMFAIATHDVAIMEVLMNTVNFLSVLSPIRPITKPAIGFKRKSEQKVKTINNFVAIGSAFGKKSSSKSSANRNTASNQNTLGTCLLKVIQLPLFSTCYFQYVSIYQHHSCFLTVAIYFFLYIEAIL